MTEDEILKDVQEVDSTLKEQNRQRILQRKRFVRYSSLFVAILVSIQAFVAFIKGSDISGPGFDHNYFNSLHFWPITLTSLGFIIHWSFQPTEPIQDA